MESKTVTVTQHDRNLRRKSIFEYWEKSSKLRSDLEFLSEKYGYCIPYIVTIVGPAIRIPKIPKIPKITKIRSIQHIANSTKDEIRNCHNLGVSIKKLADMFSITERKAKYICNKKNSKKEKEKEEKIEKQKHFNKTVLDLWISGYTCAEIARKISESGKKISRQRIHMILLKNMDSVIHENNKPEILRDFANGDSKHELAKKYNMELNAIHSILIYSGFMDRKTGYKKKEEYKIFRKSVLDTYEKFKDEPDWILKVTSHLKCYASDVTNILRVGRLYKSSTGEGHRERISNSQTATWASGVRNFWEELCSLSWISALKRVIAMSSKCKTINRQHAQKNAMLKKLYELHPDAPEKDKKIIVKKKKVESLITSIEKWKDDII